MKKILSFLSLAIAGLLMTACSEDFKDWEQQKPIAAEDAITIPGFTASATGAIDLARQDDDVTLLSLSSAALPDGFVVKSIRMDVTPAGGGETVRLTANDAGAFSKSALQQLVEQAYGKRPTSRLFDAHVYASAVKDGQAAFIDAGTIQLNLTPEAPQISENYYIVGGPNSDWAGSAAARSIKFGHSGKDVYDDPVFTVIFDAAAEGDTWFAIGDDAACDAIGNSDWSKLLGIVGGNSTATEGQLDFRYNMGAENSFCVPAGTAKKIKVTIDMMDYTFKVETVNVADNYYLVGGPLDWTASAASKEQKFAHSSQSVADDPVFTYVMAGTGGDMWFAIGDDEACDAITNNGDWSKLYGTTAGDGNSGESGTLARRSSLSDNGSFKVDGQAKFYRIQINMAELTYTVTALNFAEYFYEIGNESGWSTSHALYGPAGDGKYQGYYYLDGEFKFKPNEGDWTDDLEYVSGDATSGTLTSGGGPNCPAPGAGFYQIDLDAAGMSYSLTKVDVISIIGDFNGWGADVDMTFNAAEGCWEATTTVTDGGLKFRMNHDWAVSWGGNGSGDAFDNLTQHNGANLNVSAGTYKFQLYISYEGNNRVVVTKQ